MTDQIQAGLGFSCRGWIEQESTEITEIFSVSSAIKDRDMHPLFLQASGITHDVIGAAIEVHKDKDLDYLNRSTNGA